MIVERGEEWERELLEVCAAGCGRRHGAECLGASEVAWLRRGIERQVLAGEAIESIEHHYRKPNRMEIIP